MYQFVLLRKGLHFEEQVAQNDSLLVDRNLYESYRDDELTRQGLS